MDYSLYTKGENVTAKPTIMPLPDDSPCGPVDGYYNTFEAYSLIASAGVIVCLALLEKRSNKVCQCAGQRPGLVYPVNLLDHGCDNFGYSMAFGSVASYCFTLFFDTNNLYGRGPAWSKTLYVMLYVLMYGLMFYPLFACLTTTWIFVGSLLGLGYTGLWIYSNLRTVILCPNGTEGDFPGQYIAVQIPVLFCLLCLFLRYGFILIKHLVHVIKDRRVGEVIQQYEREHLGTKYNVQYVKELLVPACRAVNPNNVSQAEDPNWRKRCKVYFRRYIYMNDPTFKYSPRIICIFTVALICAYQFGILIILGAYGLQDLVSQLNPGSNFTEGDKETYKQIRLFLRVSDGSMIFSFCISSLLTVFSIFQILTHYRQDIKRMYKGNFSHLPFKRDGRHPQFIMSDSLSYAGSQIAYTLWGYVIVFVVLLITCLILMYLIVLPALDLIPRDFLKFLWNILPGFVILQALLILQTLFSRLLLQTRSSVDQKGNETSTVVLALNNRKVYHNVSYFLFFFYIVLGVFGCFVTIIKGVILGILYLARLDKCGLLPGYERWDKGYMYYVSFLHIEECHRHPVLLVFCDILVDNIHDKENFKLRGYGGVDSSLDDVSTRSSHSSSDLVQEPGNGVSSAHSSYRIVDKTRRLSRNRWLKAYTMIRNPGLKCSDIEDDYDTLRDIETPNADTRRKDKVFASV